MRSGKRVIAVLISLVYLVTRALVGTIQRPFGRREQPHVVLTYHAISAADAHGFERQMAFLKRRVRTVFADELDDDTATRAVAVTFDDAFQSVVDRAVPILRQHGIPASVFVPTGYLGTLPRWNTDGDLRSVPDVVASAEVLGALNQKSVRIGSHTVSHPRLADLDDRALETELVQSRSVLEQISKGQVRMISLPYGSCSPKVVDAARRAGYRWVFANVPVKRLSSSPLCGRINVSPRDWPIEYCLKAFGAYEWMALAVPLKRALQRGAPGAASSSGVPI